MSNVLAESDAMLAGSKLEMSFCVAVKFVIR